MWVAIFLFTVSLNAQIDKTFSSEKECWDYYNKKFFKRKRMLGLLQ